MQISNINNTDTYITSKIAKAPKDLALKFAIPLTETKETENTQVSKSVEPASVADKLNEEIQKIIDDKNLNINKKDVRNFLKKFAMHHGIDIQTEAQNLTQEKADKILKSITSAIEQLEACNKEITLEEIVTTIGLNIAGVSREEYEKAVANGEAKSIREELGLADDEILSRETTNAFMKKLVLESLEKVNKGEITPDEAAAYIKKKIALVKAATPGSDKEALCKVIYSAGKDNVAAVAKILLFGLDVEKQKEICEKLKLDFNEIVKSNGLTQDDITELSILLDEKTSSEELSKENKVNAQKYQEFCENEKVQEFINKYGKADEFLKREDVAQVLVKIYKGEKLTPEEKQLQKEIEIAQELAIYTGTAASRMMVVTNRGDNKIAKEMNYENYQLDIYNDIMTNIKNYVEKHHEEMGISVEDFAIKMDNITNGNYSLISVNPEVEKTDLNAPDAPAASSSADLGYTTKSNVNTSNLDNLTAQILEQSRVESNNFEIVKETSDNAGVQRVWDRKEIAKAPGQFIKEHYSKVKNTKTIRDMKFAFTRTSSTVQTNILELASGSLVRMFLPEASNRVVAATTKGSSTYTSKLLAEAREDAQEQMI